MARNVTTGDKLVLSVGACVVTTMSMGAIIRTPASLGSNVVIMHLGTSAAVRLVLFVTSTELSIYNGSATSQSGIALSTSTWYFVGVGKTTGSSAPGFHVYNYGTGAWTHATGAANTEGGTTPDRIELGTFNDGSLPLQGDIAAAAIWDRVLTDAEFERLAFTLQAWHASKPVGLWVLDQSAVGQTVHDLTGGGANESARTVTTVSTVSVPIWNYGESVTYITREPAAVAADPPDGSRHMQPAISGMNVMGRF